MLARRETTITGANAVAGDKVFARFPAGFSTACSGAQERRNWPMVARIEKHGLQVARELVEFIERTALPDTGVSAAAFWAGM